MPKRNLRGVKKSAEKAEDKLDKPEQKYVEEVQEIKHSTSEVALKSVLDAKINATGHVTGNSYVFNGAGSVVYVDERDVEYFLNKRQGGRQCCGGGDYGNVMFILAEVE